MVSVRRVTQSPVSRQAFRRRLVFAGLWAVVLVLTIGLGVASGVFVGFLRDLPSLEGLEEYQPSITTTLYSDQDEPFASFYEQRRILLPLGKVPLKLKQAVLAVEDSRFYEHHGLSPRAIARAMLMNTLARRKAQGGSTIIPASRTKNALHSSQSKGPIIVGIGSPSASSKYVRLIRTWYAFVRPVPYLRGNRSRYS